MNFSVHMDDVTLRDLDQTAKEEGKSRSALLKEAFKAYLEERRRRDKNNGWPQSLIDHLNNTKPEDFADLPDFGDTSDLLPLKDPVL
jgi:metal-responsive CopG/Arc/MetJ family transcriptional regulator